MSISLPDNFTETELSNYDTPFSFSTTFLNQILANQHIDLRIFNNNGIFRLRTQSDLDLLTQTQLDAQTQTQLEQVQTAPGEAWATTGSPTGVTGSLSVGPIASYDNWSGAKLTLSGAALDVTLQSSMTTALNGSINISAMDFVGFVVPDFNNFNTATSTITLCSNAAGDFSSNNSAAVAFSASTGTSTYKKFGLGSFTAGGFDPTQVTGVKIRFVSASNPAANSVLTLFAIRAVKSTWKPQTFDLDTRRQRFVSAITLNGADPVPATDAFVPLVRGITSGTSDPRPMDASLTMTFSTGLLTASNSGTPYNTIQLLFRENQGGGSGRYVVGQLQFRNGSTIASSYKTSSGATVSGSTINYTALPNLSANSFYIFQADLTNQAMTLSLWQSNLAGNFLTKLWSSTATSTGTNSNYVREQGRVGWNLSLVDRDTTLMRFNAATTAFSTLRTKTFNTYNPVDGAQLTATFSSDTNLWRNFQGQDIFIDTQKSLSGRSYRASYPIFSNDVFVEDWAQMYVEFDIFVPSQAAIANQPYCSITSSSALTNIILPKLNLQPNQWNHINIDLDQVQGNPTGIYYRVWIGFFTNALSGVQIPYQWWVDNPIIGRRNVSWQMQANPTLGVWREFREAVNDPYGALKLPPQERGTALKLQAVALTQDAWVKDYTLLPHYAELGRFTFG